MIDAERWLEVRALLDEALKLGLREQAEFLDRIKDSSIRNEVASLLQATNVHSVASGQGTFAAAVGARFGSETTVMSAMNPTTGPQIDAYRLIQLIGEGGMGEVWLAEQKEPLQRRVALKLIKPGMDTKEVIARFQSERQALALMDHPAIARVFDAGVTSLGRPYFTMEYVPGLPITDYCDKHKLTVRDRLDLFRQICEGVQHAHQKAVIHRDLKPSNILIAEKGDRPLPKIIDFGIAKALSQRLNAETMVTRLGAVVGTPEYMSPEQVDCGGEDVDTRADVYALGVVLYEILAGSLPVDYRNLPFDVVLRKIREEDAQRPSSRLRNLGQDCARVALNRGSTPRALPRQLRGDLDSIVLKALEKDRRRRYGSPSDLAADLQRFLKSEPVVAARSTMLYRTKKYFNRHRFGVLATACFTLLLFGFAITEAVQVRQITRERDRADYITDFITEMFAVPRAGARGTNIPVSEVIDKGIKDLDGASPKDLGLQAQMRRVLGTVLGNLGFESRAETLLSQSLDVQRRLLGPNNRETLRTMSSLSSTLIKDGREVEAERLLRETINGQSRELGPRNPETLKSMAKLGVALSRQDRLQDAEKLLYVTVQADREVLGSENAQTLAAIGNLTQTLDSEGKYREEERFARESIELGRKIYGAEDLRILGPMLGLVALLVQEHRYTAADSFAREAVTVERATPGTDNFLRFQARGELMDVLSHEGKESEAEEVGQQSLSIIRHELGKQSALERETLYNLACVAALAGNREKALTLLHQAIGQGFDDFSQMRSDPDLISLRSDSRFATLASPSSNSRRASK